MVSSYIMKQAQNFDIRFPGFEFECRISIKNIRPEQTNRATVVLGKVKLKYCSMP